MSTGTGLRDQGFHQLDLTRAIGDDWYERAHRLVESWPRGFLIDAEVVRANCGDPLRPNALGRLFHAAAKAGLIEQEGWNPRHAPNVAALRSSFGGAHDLPHA